MDSSGNSHCGKPRYIGLRLALHILVVTKCFTLVSYSSPRCDTESPYLPVTALLCLGLGIYLNDTNLKIGIWAGSEHVMFFLYGPDFRELPKRERITSTHPACTCLQLILPTVDPVLRMTLQKQERWREWLQDKSGWGVNKTGRQPGPRGPDWTRIKQIHYTVNCSCYMESITRSLWELERGWIPTIFSSWITLTPHSQRNLTPNGFLVVEEGEKRVGKLNP